MHTIRKFTASSIVVTLFAFMPAHAKSNKLDPLVTAKGSWGWIMPLSQNLSDEELAAYAKGGCGGADMLSITIDVEALRYYSEQAGVASVSDITQIKSRSFAVSYEGEERLMENGKPQIWHMLIVDENTITWVLDDWVADGGRTPLLERCDVEMS